MLREAVISVLRASMVELKMEQELTLFNALLADLTGGGLDVVESHGAPIFFDPPPPLFECDDCKRKLTNAVVSVHPSKPGLWICDECTIELARKEGEELAAAIDELPYCEYCESHRIGMEECDCPAAVNARANANKDSVSNPTPQPAEGVEVETESSIAGTVLEPWTCEICGFRNGGDTKKGQCKSDECIERRMRKLYNDCAADDPPADSQPAVPPPSASRTPWNYVFAAEAGVHLVRQMVDRDSASDSFLRELSIEMGVDLGDVKRLAMNTHRLRAELRMKLGVDRDEAFDQLLARWKARPVAA